MVCSACLPAFPPGYDSFLRAPVTQAEVRIGLGARTRKGGSTPKAPDATPSDSPDTYSYRGWVPILPLHCTANQATSLTPRRFSTFFQSLLSKECLCLEARGSSTS